MKTSSKVFNMLVVCALVGAFVEAAADYEKFDVDGQDATSRAGFAKRGASGSSFPPLVGSGLSWAHFTFEPCGMNPHHFHPFGNELIYVIEGDDLEVAWTDGNGNPGAVIKTMLNQGETTLLPIGSVHYQINQSCKKVVTISALSSDSAGTVTIAPALFAFDDEAVGQAMGIPARRVSVLREKEMMRSLQKKCFERCGLGN